MEEGEFWSILFEKYNFSHDIAEIADLKEERSFEIIPGKKWFVKSSRASKLGENYMSDVYSVTATDEENKVFQAFVKVVPSHPLLRESSFAMGTHQCETAMYTHFFDILIGQNDESGLAPNTIPLNVPKKYYINLEVPVKGITDGSKTAFVLEDLKMKGFKMADKTKSCCEHVTVALKSLANYHALTICYLRKLRNPDGSYNLPTQLKFLERQIFEEKQEEVVKHMMTTHMELIKKLNLGKADEWMQSIIDNVVDYAKFEDIKNCGPLSCVLHGDYWNNNMLFLYDKMDEKKPIDQRMVDWQISHFGHPSSDILYYLYTAMDPEMRHEHFSSLLHYYFTTLKSSLKILNVDLDSEGYTEQDFLRETKQRMIGPMIMSLMALPAILDSNMADSLKEMENNEEQLAKIEKELQETGKSAAADEHFKGIYTADLLLKNTALAKRIAALIEEVQNNCC